ncbi:hypothetical protein QBC45DRAFT_322408, partial [Copromyces sp. CBS 386.78]
TINNKINNKNGNTNAAFISFFNNNINNNSGSNKKSIYTICNNIISKDYIYCICGYYCNSKITCEPDKAFNIWKNKEEVRRYTKPSNISITAALGNINTILINPAIFGFVLLFNRGSIFNIVSFGGGKLGFY